MYIFPVTVASAALAKRRGRNGTYVLVEIQRHMVMVSLARKGVQFIVYGIEKIRHL